MAGSLGLHSLWGAESTEAVRPGIIDTHTHFYDPTRPEGVPWPPQGEKTLYRRVMPEEFEARTQPFGVTGTVVVEASPWLEDNQWLLDLADRSPVILGIVGNLKIAQPEFQSQLARFAQHPLFKGLRIQTPFKAFSDQKQFDADIKAFLERGLTLDVNGGPEGFADILALKKRYRDLKVVVEHLPKSPSADPLLPNEQADAEAELASLPNVYAKVSYVLKMGTPVDKMSLDLYRDQLNRIWKQYGPDRVLYGSNWPVSDRVAPYSQIIGLMTQAMEERSSEESDKFFRRNALTAYQLKAR